MSENPIARVVESNEAADIFAAAEWVLSIPRIPTQAIAVCTGLGEQIRVMQAIKRWRESGAQRLILTGINPNEKTYDALTLERLQQKPYLLTEAELPRVLTQVEAAHTKAQAQWLVGQVYEHGIRSVELQAPPYHITRAYLTVLAAMDATRPFILTAHATPMSPEYVIPETGVAAITMTAGEYQRILKYQTTGDVASLDQLKTYQRWLWQQPEFASFK